MSSTTSDRIVTRQDIAGALVAMGCLHKRVSINPEVEFAAYEAAIEGVKACDLGAAVKSILQGALGHAFFPAPPELRMRCDAIREQRIAEAAKQLQRDRQREEAAAFTRREPTPEAKARVADLMAKFRAGVQIMPGASK